MEVLRLLLAAVLLISVCILVTAQEATSAGNPLADTEWMLTSFVVGGTGTPVMENAAITLKFGSDGRAGGSGGCNTFGAEYSVSGNRISFSRIISTRRACLNQRMNQQEQQYFRALESAETFRVSQPGLTIFHDDGRNHLSFLSASTSSPDQQRYDDLTNPVAQIVDLDRDGLFDSLEQELAEKYAPIVFHSPDEPNFPTSVELFLSQTELWFYDGRCKPGRVNTTGDLRSGIPRHRQRACVSTETDFDSHGTRSRGKKRSYFLKNVEGDQRKGSADPRNWITYYHAYSNDIGGITIQYWRFYAYNTGYILGLKTSIGSHGGDWEAIHIVLDANHKPTSARFLGHRSISSKAWSSLRKEGDHLFVKSEKGGHTSKPFGKRDEKRANQFIRHETWSGGHVSWPKNSSGSRIHSGGALLNLGEKSAPMSKMEFLQYSGLWGTRESGGLLPTLRSGYWGPAFNETSITTCNFITAWCEGMSGSLIERVVQSNSQNIRECYPNDTIR